MKYVVSRTLNDGSIEYYDTNRLWVDNIDDAIKYDDLGYYRQHCNYYENVPAVIDVNVVFDDTVVDELVAL